MKLTTSITLVALAASSMTATAQDAFQPIHLKATDFIIATGQPSLLTWKLKNSYVPVWSLSGGTVGQSVSAITPPLPKNCAGVKVELLVASEESSAKSTFSDVYRAHLSQLQPGVGAESRGIIGKPVRTPLADGAPSLRTITVEPYRIVEPGLPLVVRIQREPGDSGDTYPRPAGLVSVTVTPLPSPPPIRLVQDRPGYNSWPMMQALGDKLVCAYSSGTAHNIVEGVRGVYARTSKDGGKTWEPEVCVTNQPDYGEVTIGKGLDENGAMLLWVRCYGGPKPHHSLYRTVDGTSFELISTPPVDPLPMQIMDVVHIPTVGLVSFWFSGYKDGSCAWGTMVSTDNGATWTQNIVEDKLKSADLPTEQSMVYLGDGKILGMARTESHVGDSQFSQFQLTSTDYGKTWTKQRTNIRNIMSSSPSLILDAKTGYVSNYYYERGRGVIFRRRVKPEDVFEDPMAWPDAEAVALGSEVPWESGNCNATFIGDDHYVSFYSGSGKQTSVYIAHVPPVKEEK
jgi:hypothetical protein